MIQPAKIAVCVRFRISKNRHIVWLHSSHFRASCKMAVSPSIRERFKCYLDHPRWRVPFGKI